MSTNKKYGLIVPDKSKQQSLVFQASRNVFGDDSDSEEDSNRKPVLLQPSHNINRQAKIAQTKAVVEDPTVFQYDEVYDAMKSEKEGKKEKNKEIKKPKYIENLLKTANKRKIENERRIERQIQKERELEGDEFADKEVFVTSAYKKKLEEISLEEEKEKREQYLESIGDVTKQQDLGGFYRHLYEQKLGLEKGPDTEDKQISKELHNEKPKTPRLEKGNELSVEDNKETSKRRNYRKRKSSSESKKQLSEGEVEDSDEEINRLNLDDIKMAKKVKFDHNIDADSDFSIDESSDDEEIIKKSDDGETTEDVFKKPECVEMAENKSKTDVTPVDTNPKDVIEKPRVNIWKKRTVGEVFEQALRRYYERKAARSLM